MSNSLTWNYRIIMDDQRETPWIGIYAVYYLDGKPIDHSQSMATPFGETIEDVTNHMKQMQTAFYRAVLLKSQFPDMSDHRRKEWSETGNAVSKWQEYE